MTKTIEAARPVHSGANVPATGIKATPLTCTIGAEVSGINLGDAARDDALFAQVKALLLQYKVLFLRGQDITRAGHVAFARRFGELEDHLSPATIRTTPAWYAFTRAPAAKKSRMRTRGIATPPGAPRRRWAVCCVASNAPRWAATPCGPTWARPMQSCPKR